ncbi:MAG: aldo/keto reductase [Bacteroidales bacterium]|nr:aldo/keto reductase [Bacteroidales bacterium]
MNYRTLGKTGFKVAEISLGTWQLGGKWGNPYDKTTAEKILHEAVDAGINFIDTADVYNNGMSEQSIGRFLKKRPERIYVASKCGRRLNPHISESYQPDILRKHIEDSLNRLQLETLDLIQLHCPPTEVYARPEIFGLFDELKKEGKILNMGVSVETVDEAMQALSYDNVTSVQIIFNMFRMKPAEAFFKAARERKVGIIVRVPLASGLLTGKFSAGTKFGPEDHRNFNRDGAAFDKGETFSGVDYETGLAAVEELKALFPESSNLAPLALRWILMHPEVSCIIPGASRPEQVESNLKATDLPDLDAEQLERIRAIYDERIRPLVHDLW